MSSETRSPVWIIVSRSAWSRHPIQQFLSGASSRASISVRFKKQTRFFVKALMRDGEDALNEGAMGRLS